MVHRRSVHRRFKGIQRKASNALCAITSDAGVVPAALAVDPAPHRHVPRRYSRVLDVDAEEGLLVSLLGTDQRQVVLAA